MKKSKLSLLVIVIALFLPLQTMKGQAAQPTVMILPDINSELSANPEALKNYLESNKLMELCISRVKEAFTTRGYPVRDFVKALALMKVDALVSADQSAATNTTKMIAQSSDAEISIYVSPKLIHHGGGMSEVILLLDAQESKLGNSFANASFSSDKFNTSDSIKLATRALDQISNNFFYQIEEGFSQMVREGRNMRFSIEFAADCEMDAYAEVGENGLDLTGELDEWASTQSGKVTNSSDKFINLTIKVPVYDTDGSPYPIGRQRSKLQSQLNKWLRPLGYKARTVLGRDQVIHFLISDNE